MNSNQDQIRQDNILATQKKSSQENVTKNEIKTEGSCNMI